MLLVYSKAAKRQMHFVLAISAALRAEAVDDELLTLHLHTVGHIDVGKGLTQKTDHLATTQTKKMGMVARATNNVGIVGAKPPLAVDALDPVHNSCFLQEIQVPVYGDPIQLSSQGLGHLTVRSRPADAIQGFQDRLPGIRGLQARAFQNLAVSRHGLLAKGHTGKLHTAQ